MNKLNNLLSLLLEHNIDFVLIGGFAGVVHGSTQVTRDLDICMAINSATVEKLRDCLKKINPKHRNNPNFKASFLDTLLDVANFKNIYLETDFGVLDILTEVTGVGDFYQIKSNSVEVEIFGHKCKVISMDDLISAKQAMGRDKDKIVVKELSTILKLRKK